METIKLTEEELSQIQEIQQSQGALIQELGQVSLSELNLQARKNQAESFLNDLRSKEEALGKELTDKYGDGTVNVNTGEFEPRQ